MRIKSESEIEKEARETSIKESLAIVSFDFEKGLVAYNDSNSLFHSKPKVCYLTESSLDIYKHKIESALSKLTYNIGEIVSSYGAIIKFKISEEYLETVTSQPREQLVEKAELKTVIKIYATDDQVLLDIRESLDSLNDILKLAVQCEIEAVEEKRKELELKNLKNIQQDLFNRVAV